MASLIDELVDVLEKENSEYTLLVDLSTKKTSTIVKNDIEEMQNIMNQEQEIVDRVKFWKRNGKIPLMISAGFFTWIQRI